MSRGRPRKAGARQPCGKLRPAVANDKGSDFVQARRASFEIFQGGKAGDHLSDPIGRAWASGLLDGHAQDAAILRDIGRRYASLNAQVYASLQVVIGDLEPRSRGTGGGSDEDRTGEAYTRIDQLARNAGSKERLAMQKLCLPTTPDEDPLWLGRLIQCRFWKRVPIERDHMIMTQAVRALVAMVEG